MSVTIKIKVGKQAVVEAEVGSVKEDKPSTSNWE